ncbi:hypothetical protein SELMODRAFT_403008 [Selaginella moellendorffii]|uniref:Uncharacterized protein n=1 Tax=Selaginella moellendorffii TaxID=88036 RepID=D8QNR7_SELML|nr:hypothetical protein SELMODRAFT_403008 [Selaginella moellendorffii]
MAAPPSSSFSRSPSTMQVTAMKHLKPSPFMVQTRLLENLFAGFRPVISSGQIRLLLHSLLNQFLELELLGRPLMLKDLADAITSCYDSSKKSFWESLDSQASEIKAISKLEEVLRDKAIPQNWRVKQPKLKIKDPDVQKELNELAGFKHTEYQLTLLSLLLDARKRELVIFSGQVKNACRTFDDHLLDIVLTALQDPSSRSLLQRELATMVYAKRDLFAKDVVFAQANRRLQEQNRQNAEDARLAVQDKAKLLSSRVLLL